MADLYLTISEQPDAVLEAIASSMDDRINDPNMRAICSDYMSALPGPGREILEIGCGNGASTELLLEAARPSRLVGVDPAAGLLERARNRFAEGTGISFEIGDAVMTRQADASFDIVLAHTVFSHLAEPLAALREAYRVLKPGGTLAIFDGDYATNTVSLFEGDPLQAAMVATQRNLIHDPYLMRRLPQFMIKAGFQQPRSKAHGFVQTSRPDYLLSLLSRGVTAGSKAGEYGDQLATAFQAEARRRVEDGSFYGAILFISTTATKPH